MSTQVQINDVPPKTQITATAGQTVFTTNWTANAASDVVVYARTSAQTPDDLTQLVSNVNYSVAFVGGSEIVEVTFLVGRALGDVITITRDTPADRLNLYTNTNFTPSMINQDIGVLTLVDQQAQLYNNQVAPHYNVSSTPDLGDPMTGEGGDIYLPILGANEGWKKNSSNTAIEAITFPTSGGLAPSDATYIVQTPWSPSGELPNQQALSPLATGFMTSITATGVVSTRTLLGTANQINVTNGTGTGNPVFSISNALQLPGTMTFGGNVDANGYNISNIGFITGGTWQGNTIDVAYGGTGNTTVGANGTLAQSDGTKYTFTTATYPSTTTINNILYSSANNTVSEIADAVGGVLVSDATGIPSMLANPADNYRVLQSKNADKAEWSVAAYPHMASAAGTLMQSDGTDWTHTQATYPSSTNKDHILYSSSNNTVGEIATQKDAVLVSNHMNTPVWSSSMTDGQVIIGKTNDIPLAANLTAGTGMSIVNGNNSITLNATGGTVNSGTANQLAYYATTGTAVSGLTSANSATLVTDNSGVPAWTGSMTDGQLLIGSTGATPVLATLTAGPGISIANAAGSITVSGTGSGIGWTEVTGASQTMAADNGYVANNAGLVTLTLPTTAAFGTVINIVGKGAGGWKIAQGAGQNIQVGATASTVGVTGYIASTNQFDSIELLCTTADTVWTVLGGPQGNITVA